MIPFPTVGATAAAVFMPAAASFPHTFLLALFCSGHISLLKTPQKNKPFLAKSINDEEMWRDPCDAPNWISTL